MPAIPDELRKRIVKWEAMADYREFGTYLELCGFVDDLIAALEAAAPQPRPRNRDDEGYDLGTDREDETGVIA